jgi:uncharacterized protein (TIGR00730 family)
MDSRHRLEHIKEVVVHKNDGERLKEINDEFEEGFKFIQSFPNVVTFFGSTRATETSHHYKLAREIAGKLVKDVDATIVTGGAAGIMEAGNRGAKEAGGRSVGLTIDLAEGQLVNQYLTDQLDFYYFFARKFMLSYAAKAFVFFPGGYGTLDEFFEILTLAQTDKIEPTPIICVDGNYWRPLLEFNRELMLEEFEAISPGDLSLFTIVNHPHQVVEAIREHFMQQKVKIPMINP